MRGKRVGRRLAVTGAFTLESEPHRNPTHAAAKLKEIPVAHQSRVRKSGFLEELMHMDAKPHLQVIARTRRQAVTIHKRRAEFAARTENERFGTNILTD
jgi:hypothetical protein